MQFNNAAIAACSFGTLEMQFAETQTEFIFLIHTTEHKTVLKNKIIEEQTSGIYYYYKILKIWFMKLLKLTRK